MSVLVNVTPPAGYSITLEEAKAHLRVTDDSHDDRIMAYLASATSSIESLREIRLVEQTVRLELDGFPETFIDIPIAPVISVTSVKYDDSDNVEQTLVENTDYFVSLGGRYPKITAVDEWPTAYVGKPSSVRVVMVVGYATDSSPLDYGENVPLDLKHAIKVKIKEFFDHGGETIVGNNEVSPSANTVEALTLPYKRWYMV